MLLHIKIMLCVGQEVALYANKEEKKTGTQSLGPGRQATATPPHTIYANIFQHIFYCPYYRGSK
jgi:hypothetical protein